MRVAVFGLGNMVLRTNEKYHLALRTKLQASVGKEQLQLTVFTARYLLGQVEASSV